MKAHIGIKNNPDVDRLIQKIRDGKIILWAGSGLSLYAGYPSAKELCSNICMAAKSKQDEAYLREKENSLQDLAHEFEQLYSRDELITLLSKHFDVQPKQEPSPYVKVHFNKYHICYRYRSRKSRGRDMRTFVKGSLLLRIVELYLGHSKNAVSEGA